MSPGIKRTAQLALLAGAMARLRWRKRKNETSHTATRPCDNERYESVARRLGLMHGLPQKIGQLLSFSDISSSPEMNGACNRPFELLCDSSAAMPYPEVVMAIEDGLGRYSRSHIRCISREGFPASLGQVHQAELQDGRKVAIKVQYPGIARALAWDLRALGWLTAPIGDMRRGFDFGAYRKEIGSTLAEELDYEREAESNRRFARRTATWSDLTVPEPVDALCSGTILTTTWLEGERLGDTRAWSQSQRDRAGSAVLRFFLHGLFDWRELHADPHPGNYRYNLQNNPSSKDGEVQVGVLDFGCVKTVPEGLRSGMSELIEHAQCNRLTQDRTEDCFLRMHFNGDLLHPLQDKLKAVALILAEPFLSSKRTRVSEWRVGSRIAEVLGEHRMAFRLAGPPEMLFLIRGFQGVLKHLDILEASLPWQKTFEESLNVNPTKAADSDQVPDPTVKNHSPMKSDSLHIEVREKDQLKVSLTFSASATDHLHDLVPKELHDMLQQRSIDVELISHQARENQYPPGELFRWTESDKQVRVWLA